MNCINKRKGIHADPQRHSAFVPGDAQHYEKRFLCKVLIIHLQAHKIKFPIELLSRIREAAAKEGENVSSLIRKIIVDYVGWEGPVRNNNNY